MAKRTEEEKVSQSGIMVKLGGAEYEVAPLVIRDARKWRRKVVGVLSGLSGIPKETRMWRRLYRKLASPFGKAPVVKSYLNATTKDPDSFDAALEYLLVTMQDTIIDLFFEYARDLDRNKIEGEATEEQIEEAFSRIVEVAFPLAQSPSMLKKRLLQ